MKEKSPLKILRNSGIKNAFQLGSSAVAEKRTFCSLGKCGGEKPYVCLQECLGLVVRVTMTGFRVF